MALLTFSYVDPDWIVNGSPYTSAALSDFINIEEYLYIRFNCESFDEATLTDLTSKITTTIVLFILWTPVPLTPEEVIQAQTCMSYLPGVTLNLVSG